jgi:hypothetical protein
MIENGKASGKPICEEASMLSRESYIPCGQPAKKVLHSPRDGRDYNMCEPCADHNRGRGMFIKGDINA